MSMVADYHRCPKCSEIWSFTPDVGRSRCSKCGCMELGPSLGPRPPVGPTKIIDAVFGKKKK